MVILTLTIYYRKKIQNKIRTGKRHTGLNPEESRSKLPESSPKAVAQDLLSSSSSGYNNTAKLMRHSVPRAFMQDYHLDTLSLTGTKVPDSQNESRP